MIIPKRQIPTKIPANIELNKEVLPFKIALFLKMFIFIYLKTASQQYVLILAYLRPLVNS